MAKPYMCGDEAPIYVPSGGCDCNYTIMKVETLEYADAYALYLNGERVGATINIPKDQVVQSGVVNTVATENQPYDGALVGDKYIMLTIANSASRVYIPMKEVMGGGYLVVDSLPAVGDSQHIYLVPNGSGGYDRYIYNSGEWVNIGDTEVDLTNYYTKSEVNALVAGYIREDANGDITITRDVKATRYLEGQKLYVTNGAFAYDHYCTRDTVNLGRYFTGGVLTSNCSVIHFSVPTGRVFKSGTTITRITGQMEIRASNSESAGLYIVSSTNSGSQSGYVTFDTNSSMPFYNGKGQSKTLPKTGFSYNLAGLTNIDFALSDSADWYFAGDSTTGAHINNNALSVGLFDFTVYFDVPA